MPAFAGMTKGEVRISFANFWDRTLEAIRKVELSLNCRTFGPDRGICGHLRHSLFKRPRFAASGKFLQRNRNQPIKVLAELGRSRRACRLYELSRESHAPAHRS